jgi:hypothetical protein
MDSTQRSGLDRAEGPPSKTVTVGVYSNGRYPIKTITWAEYVQYYDRKELDFLAKGLPRPDHLPDRATAARWAGITAEPERRDNIAIGWMDIIKKPVARSRRPIEWQQAGTIDEFVKDFESKPAVVTDLGSRAPNAERTIVASKHRVTDTEPLSEADLKRINDYGRRKGWIK